MTGAWNEVQIVEQLAMRGVIGFINCKVTASFYFEYLLENSLKDIKIDDTTLKIMESA